MVWVLPVFVPIGVYIMLALAARTPFPIVAVTSDSMAPVLHRGDLVFVRGATPAEVTAGAIIVFDVPQAARDRYSFPSRIIHRVVAKIDTGQGFGFQTKGDSTPADPFTVGPEALRAQYLGSLPWLGYPLIYVDSRRGWLSLPVALVVLWVCGHMAAVRRATALRVSSRATLQS